MEKVTLMRTYMILKLPLYKLMTTTIIDEKPQQKILNVLETREKNICRLEISNISKKQKVDCKNI